MALTPTDLAEQVIKLYGPAFVETIKRECFLLTRLEERGLIRDGKPVIVWQANYAGNTSVGSYGPGDAAGGAGKQSFKPAALDYKSVRGEVAIAGQTVAISEAGGYFVDTVRTELDLVVKDLRKDINGQLLSDGTGNSAKDITGILAAISDAGTYAGIARGTYTWWKSAVDENGGDPRNLTEALIAGVVDEVTDRGADPMSLELWCGPTQWRKFGALYKGERRQTPISLTGGYQKLDFEGTPVIKVPGYASGRMDAVDVSKFTYEMLPVTANSELARSLRNVVAVPGIPGFGILLLGNTADIAGFWVIHYGQLKCSNPYVQGSIQDLA
jgi:hypothetical protein